MKWYQVSLGSLVRVLSHCELRPGNTPLVRINSLSDKLGVEIFVSLAKFRYTDSQGKAEYLNPGGSVKDRVALQSTLKDLLSRTELTK